MTVALLHPPTDLFDDQPVTVLSDEQLGQRLTGYAGQIAALTARFLELLAEFDTRRAWSGHGVLSCAHWLCWRTGMSLRTAHEHVRIAHALTALPRLRAAFGNGELTYSKIRALTRVATPERERELLNVATSATAAQVERLVRSMRTLDHKHADKDSGSGDTDGTTAAAGGVDTVGVDSSGRSRWNGDGSLSVTLTLSALDGAAFLAGVVRAEYERTRTGDDPDVPHAALHPDPGVPRNAEHPESGVPRNAPRADTVDGNGNDDGPVDGSVPADVEAVSRQSDLWRHVPADIAPAVRVMADTLRTIIDVPGLAPTAEVIIHTHHTTDTATGTTVAIRNVTAPSADATTAPDTGTTDSGPHRSTATKPTTDTGTERNMSAGTEHTAGTGTEHTTGTGTERSRATGTSEYRLDATTSPDTGEPARAADALDTDTAADTDITPAPDSATGATDPFVPTDPHLDDGPALSDAEAAEAACNAKNSDTTSIGGVRLWWGRRRRVPTRRLVQLIAQRDRCCQHPGCGRTRHLHIHHVRAWTDGGTTDPDNLIMLCGAHHRALHRGEYRIRAHGGQRFSFHQTDGTLLEPAPALGVPGGWRPDPTIPANSTVPVNGGALDLDYTTDVLYRIWELRQQRRTTQPRAA